MVYKSVQERERETERENISLVRTPSGCVTAFSDSTVFFHHYHHDYHRKHRLQSQAKVSFRNAHPIYSSLFEFVQVCNMIAIWVYSERGFSCRVKKKTSLSKKGTRSR